MSPNKKHTTFTPAQPEQFTLAQLQSLFDFFERLSASKQVKWWALAAAIGAILDGLHVLWQAGRFLLGR